MTANMKIARMPKGTPYTITSNDKTSFAWDTRLSPTAYGILHKILSLCEKKWHFSVSGLQEIFSAGETTIRNAMKELEQLGYLVIEKDRDNKGRFTKAIYHFYESLQLKSEISAQSEQLESKKNTKAGNGLFSSSYPHCDFPHVDNLDLENQGQLITNQLNPNALNQSVDATNNSTVETIIGNSNDGLKFKKSDKQMDFSLMLYQMQCPDYDAYPEYHSEEDYADFDMEERCVQECTIPNSFQNNQATMEQALQYLFCHSQLEEGEYKNFESAVITCLSEAIHTSKLSFTNSVNPYAVIAKLNEINHSKNYSLIK